MGGNLNQENIFTRTSYVCAFAVVSTKSLIQQNVKAEIWFSHPNTSTRILVYIAASLTLLSRPRNMSFYKCMINEKLDFEIVYRKFRVGRGEGSEGVMRGVCVFCLLWNSRLIENFCVSKWCERLQWCESSLLSKETRKFERLRSVNIS